MAGIGFKINRILEKKNFASLITAYAYAGIIGSGPWLLSIASLALLGVLIAPFYETNDMLLFFAIITHIYGFTLVLTGPAVMVLARHVADLHFEHQNKHILGSILSTLAVVTPVSLILSSIFFLGGVPTSLHIQLTAIALTVIMANIWCVAIYLSALKNYHFVILAFGIGYGISLLAGWILGSHTNIPWALTGFLFGQLTLLLILLWRIRKELPGPLVWTADIFKKLPVYGFIALSGLFYNLGIWIDKFLFWWLDPNHLQISGALYGSTLYDKPTYLSILTIIPGMAVFLLRLETNFAHNYDHFFEAVRTRCNLKHIQNCKQEISYAVLNSMKEMLKIQTVVTGLLYLTAPKIKHFLGLSLLQLHVFQLLLLASYLIVFFFGFLTILYYLDKQSKAFWACFLFAAVNTLVTVWTILVAGEAWYGFGFLVGLVVAMLYAAYHATYSIKDMEYDVFTSQHIQT